MPKKESKIRKTKKTRKTKNTRKTKKTKKNRKTKKTITSVFSIDSMNLSDKPSLDNFIKSKSISGTSNPSDIKKSSYIGEVYGVKDLHNKIQHMCITKVSNKKVKNLNLNKKIAKQICECLFDKNKDLSISDLENRVLNKKHTPGSECIKILDNYVDKNKRKSSSKRSSST